MLNRWVPAVFSASCGSVSDEKFGETSEFSDCLYGNLYGFLGEDTGSVSGGSFLGGNDCELLGRNSDVFSGGYSGVFYEDSVPPTSVQPAGLVFFLEAFGALRQRGVVSTANKRTKDKIRPLDHVTDGEGTGGDPEYLEKCEQGETYQKGGPFDMWLTPKFSSIVRGSRLTKERLEDMDIGAELWPHEKEILVELLYNGEKAIAFDWQEKGRVSVDIEPPHVIRIRPGHTPWQERPMRIPRALGVTFDKLVTKMRTSGVLKLSKGPYRNPAFLIKKKKPGEYRLILSVIKQISETIRDAGLTPNVEEFSERFAGQVISSLMDFLAGYEQVPLAEESRDIRAIETEQGLMRFKVLQQGGTNNVATFVQIVNKILARCRDISRAFLDDVGVDGPRTKYNNEEAAPGVCRYPLEHIKNLDCVLCDIERSGATISGVKSEFCKDRLKAVGFICYDRGRHPASRKVIKVSQWKDCGSPNEIRAFLGL